MHETRIARSILEVLTYRISDSPRTCRAASVSVKVGELRDVNVEGLLLAFDTIKEDYPNCAHCKLLASRLEASARCVSGHKYHPHGNHSFCSVCGERMAELLVGQELEITQITLFDSAGLQPTA